MTTETQGKTTNPMDTQQENKEKILGVMTGYVQHASPILNSNVTIPLNPFQHLERKYVSFPMH